MENAEFKTKVNFWWVNQGKSRGKTFDIERSKGIISVPKRLPDMKRYYYYWENIRKVKREDIIFHHANGAIRAISIVENNNIEDIEREKDVFEHENGLAVKVRYFDIDEINNQDILTDFGKFRNALLKENGPFFYKGNINSRGDVIKKDGFKFGYLYEFSFEGAKVIRAIYGKPFPPEIEKYF